MVLGILNLEGQQNCTIGSKSTKKKFNQKSSNVGMWGVYSEARDWNIALHTQILT